VQRHHVRLPQQRVQLHVLDAQVARLLGGVDVVGQDPALEALEQADQLQPDLAGAHDAVGLVRHLQPHQPAERVVAHRHLLVRRPQVARARHDHRQRHLRHRARRVGGHADDADPARGGRRHVHPVVPRAPHGHGLDAARGQHVEHVGVAVVVDEEADGVAPGGQQRGVGVEPAGKALDPGEGVGEGLLQEVDHVVCGN
jgi:hypothetical protein